MKLNEILNKKIDYEVVRAVGTLFHTQATINDREIHFSAIDEEDGSWELSFGEKKAGGKVSYGKTGSGGELEVFSMVKASIEEFVQRYQPEQMHFTADKDGDEKGNTRADVYERLMKRFKIPGYSFKRVKRDNHDWFLFSK